MSFPAGGRPAMVRIVPDNSGHFLHPWRSHGRAGGGKIPAVSPSTASKESLTAHRIPANSASAKPLSTPQSFRPRRQQACVSHRPCGSESDAGRTRRPAKNQALGLALHTLARTRWWRSWRREDHVDRDPTCHADCTTCRSLNRPGLRPRRHILRRWFVQLRARPVWPRSAWHNDVR